MTIDIQDFPGCNGCIWFKAFYFIWENVRHKKNTQNVIPYVKPSLPKPFSLTFHLLGGTKMFIKSLLSTLLGCYWNICMLYQGLTLSVITKNLVIKVRIWYFLDDNQQEWNGKRDHRLKISSFSKIWSWIEANWVPIEVVNLAWGHVWSLNQLFVLLAKQILDIIGLQLETNFAISCF